MNDYLVDMMYDIPTVVLGLGIVATVIVIGLGGFFLTRKWVQDKLQLHAGSNDAVNGFFSGVGVLYGILLGMVAIANWNNFDDVEEVTSMEVGAIAAFYKDVGALNEPIRSALQGYVREYLDVIAEREWPEHARGMSTREPVGALEAIFLNLTNYEPDTTSHREFFSHSLDSYNRMIEMRQRRLDAVADERVPSVFWYVILYGGLLSIVMTYFFRLPSPMTHALLIGLYCAFLGLMVFLIAAVDNPFRGGVSVKPTDYVYLINTLKAAYP